MPTTAPASSRIAPETVEIIPESSARAPSVSAPRKISVKVSALSATSSHDKVPWGRRAGFRGSERYPRSSTTIPIGRLTAKSHGQEVTERMAAANDGPATEEAATAIEFNATPRPRRCLG